MTRRAFGPEQPATREIEARELREGMYMQCGGKHDIHYHMVKQCLGVTNGCAAWIVAPAEHPCTRTTITLMQSRIVTIRADAPAEQRGLTAEPQRAQGEGVSMRRGVWRAKRAGKGIEVMTPARAYPLSRTEARELMCSLQRALSDGSATERTAWAREYLGANPAARHGEIVSAMNAAGLAPISSATAARLRRDLALPKMAPGPAGRGHAVNAVGDCASWCPACWDNRAAGLNPDGTEPDDQRERSGR